MFKYTLSLVACATLVSSLQANTLTLEPVVISATKAEQSLKETTSDVQIITAAQLEEKHITSVLDVLRTLTSVPVAQSGGIGQQSSFFQRGFSSDNTVVMIDGIRYNDPTTTKGQAQLEHLMVNNIERIEIINGAQSGIWGANATAGVINIITKKATKELSIGGNIEYGSFTTTKIAVDASQKVGALSFYLGANQIKSDSFSAQTPRGKNPKEYEEDRYKNQTLNAKLGYDITSSDTLSSEFTFIDALTQYDGYASPNSTLPEVHQTNRLGNIGYRHNIDTKNYIDATYALSTFDKKDPNGYTKAFKGNNKELNVLGTFTYMDNATLVVGGNLLDSKDTISTKELDSKGLFVTNTNRFGGLILTESLRHDMYSSFDDKTTGKIGAKYFFTDDLTLASNYGTAYRTPSLYELYAPIYGSQTLRPETTKSFDVTISFMGLSATYYHNRVDNLIGFDPMTYVNEQVEGTSTLKGYEIRYGTLLAQALALDVSYSKLSAKDKDGKDLVRRPQESAAGSLTYYATSALSVGTMANYTGTRYDTTQIQTGRYALWSAFANYGITDMVTLYIKGKNLGDKRYQEVEGYGTAGRSVYTGLSARF
jgi:vitamin B12 transporter